MRKTRNLTETAIAVALAVVCHFVKIWEMPQGGAVSFTMVPILFIAIRRGPLAGFATGGIYGLISLIFHGIIFHPMSVLLDYILAFGALGIAGFFPETLRGVIFGSITAVGARFLSSFISGAVLFGSYAPVGQSPWLYSLVYQLTYMVPELIIALAVLITLYVKFPGLFRGNFR